MKRMLKSNLVLSMVTMLASVLVVLTFANLKLSTGWLFGLGVAGLFMMVAIYILLLEIVSILKEKK